MVVPSELRQVQLKHVPAQPLLHGERLYRHAWTEAADAGRPRPTIPAVKTKIVTEVSYPRRAIPPQLNAHRTSAESAIDASSIFMPAAKANLMPNAAASCCPIWGLSPLFGLRGA